ncbi:hypothetical protein L208DRAFT_1400724 [Tricholoma matsutake]|nr:hypothetical protein L208DRAFT_1400724 [Tricholoma matsutake 945]
MAPQDFSSELELFENNEIGVTAPKNIYSNTHRPQVITGTSALGRHRTLPLFTAIHWIESLPLFTGTIMQWRGDVAGSEYYIFSWLNLKFIIAGLLLEFTRHMGVVQASCDKVLDLISVRATFCQGDYSYHWVMAWLDQQKSWSRRNVDVRTTGDADPKATGFSKGLQYGNFRKISYLPPVAGTVFMSFKGHLMTVRRTQEQSTMWEGKQLAVSICMLTFDPNMLGEFTASVQTAYLATQDQVTPIHIVDTCVVLELFS